MTLLATLDRFVHRTGLDVLTPHADRQPRILRWLPLPFLAGIPAGYALFAAGLEREGRDGLLFSFAGALLFFGCFVVANLIRFFGPRLWVEQGVPLDERERAIRARAGSLSGAVLVWAVIAACFYAGYASAFGGWIPRQPVEWAYLGLGLQAWWLLLPVLIASWLQPRPPAED
jgi:hypothetical protein